MFFFKSGKKDAVELGQLAALTSMFRNAVLAHMDEDKSLSSKIVTAMKPGEIQKMQDMGMALAYGSAATAQAGGRGSDAYYRLKIKSADAFADIMGRVMDGDELADCLPEPLCRQEIADQYRRNGARALAALCERKLAK